jgi:hypothetical protein
MVSDVSFPIEYVIISILIGYLYYYLKDVDYHEILSWTSIKIGCISGLLFGTLAVLVGLLESNVFSWDNFFLSIIILGIPSMIIAILLVMIGGYFAVTVKRILGTLKR